MRILYYIILLILGLSSFSFYIHYAQHAWFIQDDFSFLQHYHDKLFWNEILNPSDNFNRFITRNLYWHGLQQLFGYSAKAYFLVNLGFILINSFLVYILSKQLTKNNFLAFAGAVMYFIFIPTIADYQWLSNSQHIIAHSFILLFFILGLRKPPHIFYSFLLITIYLLGIYSNILTLFALPPLIAYWIFEPSLSTRQLMTHKKLFICLILITLFYLILSRLFAVDAYQTHFNLPILINNIKYYFGYTVFSIIAITAIFISILLKAFKNKDGVLIFLLTASLSFYLPFAFLQFQHAPNYVALSTLFFILALFKLFSNWPLAIVVFILSNYFISIHGLINYYKTHPTGLEVKTLISQLQKQNLSDIKTLCIATKDPEAFRWQIEFGKALEVFIRPHIQYTVISSSDNQGACDFTYPYLKK